MSNTPGENRPTPTSASTPAADGSSLPEDPNSPSTAPETPRDPGQADESTAPVAEPNAPLGEPTAPVTESDVPEQSVTSEAAAPRDEANGPGVGGPGVGGPEPSATQPSATQPSDTEDATAVIPATPAAAEEEGTGRVTRDELYAREDRQGEQERLAAIRAEHEAAINQGPPAEAEVNPVPAPTPQPETRRKPLKFPRTTDKFFPSLGLLLLRLTVAAVFGVHGVQKLLTMEQTSTFFESLTIFGTPLPVPSILALATGVAEVLIAVAIAFGFGVRFAAVGIILIAVGALLMVKWTTMPDLLAEGASGFAGELELVLAGTGVLLLCVGGGGWALDRLFRRGRYSSDPQDLIA